MTVGEKQAIQTYWIMVVGLAGAGKTTFIRQAASERVPPSPQHSAQVSIQVDEHIQVRLHEAPNTNDPKILWRGVHPSRCLGAVIMVDSTNHRGLADASRQAAALTTTDPVPYVFAANKQDQLHALPVLELRILLQHFDGHLLPVLPCVATERTDVQRVLLALLELARDDYDDGIAW